MIFGATFSITVSRENCVCQEERKGCGFRGLLRFMQTRAEQAF